MNEEQFKAYLDRVQRGEQASEQERYQAMMFLNSGLSPQSSDSYGLEGGMDPYDKESTLFSVPQKMEPRQQSMSELGDEVVQSYNTPRKTGLLEANAKAEQERLRAEQERNKQFNPNQMPFLTPGGSDLTTKANQFGSSLQNPAFKGAGVIAGLSLGMGLTREVLGGVGGAKQQSYLDKYYRDKQRSNEYDTVSASGADNTVGGALVGGEFGGEFDGQGFQGQQEQPMQGEQMNEMQQMQPGQEGQADEMQQMQQIVQVVAGALQQGAQPQEVVQMLMQQGLPQEQAVAIVEEVMMQMQGGGQQQPQGQEMGQQGQPQMQDQQMMKYGGKKVSGRIKKIENGKIYV